MATARKAPAHKAASQGTAALKRAGSAADADLPVKAKRTAAKSVAPAVPRRGRTNGAADGAANGVDHEALNGTAALKLAKSSKAAKAAKSDKDASVEDAALKRGAKRPAAGAPAPLEVERPAYWDNACADLVKRDRILKKLIPQFGPAHLVKRGDPFVTLARSVVGQQISVASAQAVWERIKTACPALTPQQMLKLGAEKLIACGLSKRKCEYILDLAGHFVSGALHVDAWATMSDEDVIADLTQIRGIGRWTAEMFLIFNLSRPDVLPLDDLGLIHAISVNYFSGEPVTRSEAREVAANWEPWRTVATWYMWRSLDPVGGGA